MRQRSQQEGSDSHGIADAVVMVRRSSIAACVTCGLCGCFLRNATTISECLHAFCRECIVDEITHKDINYCPKCGIDLGCEPLAKLRADRSLQCISSMIFPAKCEMEEFSSLHPDLVSPPSQPNEANHSGYKMDAHLVDDPLNTMNTTTEGRTARSPVASQSEAEKEIAERSVAKSLFLLQEAGVWPAASEAQRTIAALQAELVTSRNETAVAREQTRVVTLSVQEVFRKLEAELTTCQLVEGERATADREARQVERAKDLALWKADQEKDSRCLAEEERDRLLADVSRLQDELASAWGTATLQTRLAQESKIRAVKLSALLQTVRDQASSLEAKLKAEQEKNAAQTEATKKLTTEISELKQQLTAGAASNEQLRQELQGAKMAAADAAAKREQLELGLGIVSRELHMETDSSRPLEADLVRIPTCAEDLVRAGLQRGVHKAVSIICSHYPLLDYETMEGWSPGYSDAQLDDIEEGMAPVARRLSAVIEEEITAGDDDDDGGSPEQVS